MEALDRSGYMREGVTLVASAQQGPGAASVSARARMIPDISMVHLIGAAFVLCAIFLGGLLLAAAARESKVLAEARVNAGRWVYRMAS
jgi:hypothetical protein